MAMIKIEGKEMHIEVFTREKRNYLVSWICI